MPRNKKCSLQWLGALTGSPQATLFSYLNHFEFLNETCHIPQIFLGILLQQETFGNRSLGVDDVFSKYG